VSVRLALSDIVAATGGRLVTPADPSAGAVVGTPVPDTVTGVVTDSRAVRPGDLFVALRGPRTDGHQFVAEAFARGAAAALVARAAPAPGPLVVVSDTLRAFGIIAGLHRRALPVTVVGVTGSVGKTTTVGLCASVLTERFRTARSAESWNAEIGVAFALLSLDASVEVAVLELAMRGPGQIRELVGLAMPRIGVVTNVADTHLELLGAHENIAAAKAELIEGLPSDGIAIVNADDPWTPRVARDAPCRIVTFGRRTDADVRAADLEPFEDGTRFVLHIGPARAPVRLGLIGTHQVQNAAAAAATGHAMGQDLDAIVRGLERATPTKMRQHVSAIGDLLVVDDSYNASPQSMAAAFEVVSRVRGARRVVLVLGEMLELGPEAPDFHRRVGEQVAAVGAAALIAVGPNARWYLDGAAAGGMAPGSMTVVSSNDAAIPVVRQTVQRGDLVLIKGSRGIEMERIVDALKSGASVAPR
jgi:UDP-N-acetylmuramoyl-tripeptide--D-alanyl-D-alanine ligase